MTAVIQVKPGIGDVIWHLPFVRAIATAAPDGQVTFFAPPTSAARDLLAAEPRVAATVYFQHAGSEWQRGVNLVRLVALLRRHHLQSLWILDRTIRPALAAALAGIPERIGLGLGPQSAFITNDGIGQEHFHDHPIDWLRALMAAMKVPLSSTEPNLQVPIALLGAVGERGLRNSPAPGSQSGSAPRIQTRTGPTPPGANFCARCGRPAPSFWSEDQPMRRGRKNLSPFPVQVRSLMRAVCD